MGYDITAYTSCTSLATGRLRAQCSGPRERLRSTGLQSKTQQLPTQGDTHQIAQHIQFCAHLELGLAAARNLLLRRSASHLR